MVCPVKIPFHKQLVSMRHYVRTDNEEWKVENKILKTAEKAMHYPSAFRIFSKILRLTPKSVLKKALKEWSKYKELPSIPKERFIK